MSKIMNEVIESMEYDTQPGKWDADELLDDTLANADVVEVDTEAEFNDWVANGSGAVLYNKAHFVKLFSPVDNECEVWEKPGTGFEWNCL